jgi:hypothetical protein
MSSRHFLLWLLVVLLIESPSIGAATPSSDSSDFKFVIPHRDNGFRGCGGEPNVYGSGITMNAATCACLIGKLGWHLIGDKGDYACRFRTPPMAFDPSHASVDELESWGIPKEDAAALSQQKSRRLYFGNVYHVVNGYTITNQKITPFSGTHWCSPSGLSCQAWSARNLCPVYVGDPNHLPPLPNTDCGPVGQR